MLITSIFVKSLAILDAFLSYFATVTVNSQANVCGTLWTTYGGTTTDCFFDWTFMQERIWYFLFHLSGSALIEIAWLQPGTWMQ